MRRGHCACEVRGPPRGRARPYSCFVLERRNSAIMLPKLYIVPLDELLGIFHRGLIVGAHKSNCSADKTVFVHDVSSILGHIGGTPKSLRTTSVRAVCLVPDSETLRFGLGEAKALIVLHRAKKGKAPDFSEARPFRHGVHPPVPSICTLCHANRSCQRIATATKRRSGAETPRGRAGRMCYRQGSHEIGTPSVTLRRFLIICPSQFSASHHRSERWPPRLPWCSQYPSAGTGCEPGYGV